MATTGRALLPLSTTLHSHTYSIAALSQTSTGICSQTSVILYVFRLPPLYMVRPLPLYMVRPLRTTDLYCTSVVRPLDLPLYVMRPPPLYVVRPLPSVIVTTVAQGVTTTPPPFHAATP